MFGTSEQLSYNPRKQWLSDVPVIRNSVEHFGTTHKKTGTRPDLQIIALKYQRTGPSVLIRTVTCTPFAYQ